MKPLFLAVSTLAFATASLSDRADSLFISHVAVVDVIAGQVRPDMTVEINGRMIASVGPAASAQIPRNATVVDGRGKFLIPGLWDMHVHIGWPAGAEQIFLPMMVANGVLGARDMHSDLARILILKRAIASGSQVGPRLFVAGTAIDGPNSYLPISRVVHTEEEARDAVRQLKSAGVDFIKVYSSLPRDLYFAVAAEAKRERIPFVGHVPYPVTAAEASDAGQRSMEHLLEVDVGTTRAEDSIKLEETESMNQHRGSLVDATRIRATYDSAKAAALFDRFRRNGTWQTPTLRVVYQPNELAHGRRPADDSLTAYIPKMLQDFWRSLPADVDAKMGAIYSFRSDLVGQMNRAGVQLLAGSDAPNAWVYHGFSLHEELGLLVRAGLSPAEALRTATINPARFLGVTDSLGVVGPGKVADLVLLDANPLENISNTKRIRAVIQGGRLMDRRGLDEMLAGAKRAAAAGGGAPAK